MKAKGGINMPILGPSSDCRQSCLPRCTFRQWITLGAFAAARLQLGSGAFCRCNRGASRSAGKW